MEGISAFISTDGGIPPPNVPEAVPPPVVAALDDEGVESGPAPEGRSSQVKVSVLVWLVGLDLRLQPLDNSLDISLATKETS